MYLAMTTFDDLAAHLSAYFDSSFRYIVIGLTLYGFYVLCKKIIDKIRKGDVAGAKEDAHKAADKIVDFLVDVIEKHDLKEAKEIITKEAEGNPEVKTNLNIILEDKGYLKRREDRGN